MHLISEWIKGVLSLKVSENNNEWKHLAFQDQVKAIFSLFMHIPHLKPEYTLVLKPKAIKLTFSWIYNLLYCAVIIFTNSYTGDN